VQREERERREKEKKKEKEERKRENERVREKERKKRRKLFFVKVTLATHRENVFTPRAKSDQNIPI